jgi:formamidopyrimidine-DNA glycosylase
VPELPEVETIRRFLEPRLPGRVVTAATITDPRLSAPLPPRRLAAALCGRRFTSVDRRGKYLLLGLEPQATLIAHLRMTGAFLHGPHLPTTLRHCRARLVLDDHAILAYTDQRRFGTWVLVDDAAARDAYLTARLGPEPFQRGFAALFSARLEQRRSPIKALILDQRIVAGVGNIYADEALYHARIHPLTPAGDLSADQKRRLALELRRVLRAGIDAQGATIRDYRTPSGGYGSMQERFSVFGRAGARCRRCGHLIMKLRVAGRGTHVCPHCQPQGAA